MPNRDRNGFKLTWRSTPLGVLAETGLVAGMILVGLLIAFIVMLTAR